MSKRGHRRPVETQALYYVVLTGGRQVISTAL